MTSAPASMAGKLCVVTGANSGIGLEIAREFASRGARVVMACRDRARAASAASDIVASTGNDAVEVRELDLAALASVRSFASGFEGPRDAVDVLVNNAGAMYKTRTSTADGHERTFQVCCLAPHLLSRLMLPSLRRAAKNAGDAPGAARIVYVGSKLEKTGDVAKRLVWACDENGAMTRDPREIFQSRGGERGEAAADGAADEGSDPFAFDTFKTYGTAKQAATALTLTLARKTRAAHGDSIVVHACTPGMVRTNLSRFMHPLAFYASQPVQWALIKSPRQGASAPVYCATSTDAVAREHTAGYFGTESSFADGPVLKLEPSDVAREESVGEELWRIMDALHGEVEGDGLR